MVNVLLQRYWGIFELLVDSLILSVRYVPGCLCGGLCCVSRRTLQRSWVWLTEACIQPTSICMKSIPSKVTNCTGVFRGAVYTHTHMHLYRAYFARRFWLPRLFLHRVLSALAHWAAIFGETDYLPLVAFPFVKLFQNNPLLCFEVVATVIGTCWFTPRNIYCTYIDSSSPFWAASLALKSLVLLNPTKTEMESCLISLKYYIL